MRTTLIPLTATGPVAPLLEKMSDSERNDSGLFYLSGTLFSCLINAIRSKPNEDNRVFIISDDWSPNSGNIPLEYDSKSGYLRLGGYRLARFFKKAIKVPSGPPIYWLLNGADYLATFEKLCENTDRKMGDKTKCGLALDTLGDLLNEAVWAFQFGASELCGTDGGTAKKASMFAGLTIAKDVMPFSMWQNVNSRQLLDATAEMSSSGYFNGKTAKEYDDNLAKLKKLMPGFDVNVDYYQAEKNSYYWRAHQAGTFLLRRKGITYVGGIDEDQHFCCELPNARRIPRTVEEAFTQLKPAVVSSAEQFGLTALRQGEWFFIPYGLTSSDKSWKEVVDVSVLDRIPALKGNGRQQVNNLHQVDGQIMESPDGKYYVRGTITHIDREGRRTDEHEDLHLSRWHQVVRNTAVRSWSAMGDPD